ncbi:CLUMA_CG007280, isoform A [Clunio marinus]|uniref:CLUMA_CG007280, isoform A n=1 Tax=Clunio marinus TaxID=568069 RepID=A0A1J1I081_9DIPT|nr:CLUMA_CG007280, isoform A [Clunio marinus]
MKNSFAFEMAPQCLDRLGGKLDCTFRPKQLKYNKSPMISVSISNISIRSAKGKKSQRHAFSSFCCFWSVKERGGENIIRRSTLRERKTTINLTRCGKLAVNKHFRKSGCMLSDG